MVGRVFRVSLLEKKINEKKLIFAKISAAFTHRHD